MHQLLCSAAYPSNPAKASWPTVDGGGTEREVGDKIVVPIERKTIKNAEEAGFEATTSTAIHHCRTNNNCTSLLIIQRIRIATFGRLHLRRRVLDGTHTESEGLPNMPGLTRAW